MIEYDPNGNFLKDGHYQFVVSHAVESTTKGGDPMIKIEIEIKQNEKTHVLRDYVVIVPKMLWRLKQLCQCVGIDYNKGQISDAELIGKKGEVEVILQDDPDYGTQNRIARYVENIKLDDDSENIIEDDDLPF